MAHTPEDLARAFGDVPYPTTHPRERPRPRRTRTSDNLPRVGLGPGALAHDDKPTAPPKPRPIGDLPPF